MALSSGPNFFSLLSGTEIVSMAIANAKSIEPIYLLALKHALVFAFSFPLLLLLPLFTHADYFNNLRKRRGAVTLKLVQLCKIFCSSLFCIYFAVSCFPFSLVVNVCCTEVTKSLLLKRVVSLPQHGSLCV